MLVFVRILIFILWLITSVFGEDRRVCVDRVSNSSSAVTALILARGGSKGIKLKNIQKIGGVSLLGISLTALQEAKHFETIWVSTDHQDIADEAERYNVNVHWRDPNTALDTTTSMESVQEFVKHHPKVNKLALIQCTSPFISHHYLRRSLRAFSKRDCVFSAVKSFKLRWRRNVKTKRIVPVNFNYAKRPRRQDWKGELIEAGMFYFSKRSLLERNLFQDDNCAVVVIKHKDSLEIDTPIDLEIARILTKFRR